MKTETINPQEPTKVIFRKFKNGGEIIALFPEIPSDIRGINCLSYMHVGQHSGASLEIVAGMTKPAESEEYKALKEELKSRGYNLKIIKRVSGNAFLKRVENLQI